MTPLDHTKELLGRLGVGVSDLHALRTLPYREALILLESLKDKVRRSWKRAALDLHPDRTGGDAAKTALFRDLTATKEHFERLTVPPPTQTVTEYGPDQVPPTPSVVFSGVGVRAPRRPPRGADPNVGRVAARMRP